VVEIDGFDYSACGGTHCPTTSMVGVVKIVKVERQNQKTRIHFVAGLQAVAYLHELHSIVTTLAEGLSLPPHDLIEMVPRLAEELKSAQKALEKLRLKYIAVEAEEMAAQAETIGSYRVIKGIFENRAVSELQALAKAFVLMPSVVALLGTFGGAKCSLVVACGQGVEHKAGDLIKQLLAPVDGRGGGNSQLAQGGGSATQEQFEQIFADIEL
jgi:alanyl-tRNA synthetase